MLPVLGYSLKRCIFFVEKVPAFGGSSKVEVLWRYLVLTIFKVLRSDKTAEMFKYRTSFGSKNFCRKESV